MNGIKAARLIALELMAIWAFPGTAGAGTAYTYYPGDPTYVAQWAAGFGSRLGMALSPVSCNSGEQAKTTPFGNLDPADPTNQMAFGEADADIGAKNPLGDCWGFSVTHRALLTGASFAYTGAPDNVAEDMQALLGGKPVVFHSAHNIHELTAQNRQTFVDLVTRLQKERFSIGNLGLALTLVSKTANLASVQSLDQWTRAGQMPLIIAKASLFKQHVLIVTGVKRDVNGGYLVQIVDSGKPAVLNCDFSGSCGYAGFGQDIGLTMIDDSDLRSSTELIASRDRMRPGESQSVQFANAQLPFSAPTSL